MPVDPRMPVIVGVAQAVRQAAEPAAWMAEVLGAACEDAGAGAALLAAADSIRTPELFSWRYPNPGLSVAGLVGASPRETVYTATGGNNPQLLLTEAAAAVQRGELDVVLLAGAEAIHTRVQAQKDGTRLPWPVQSEDVAAPRMMGGDMPGNSPFEQSRGVVVPVQVYPMFENALRAAAGRSIEKHDRHVAGLWAGFSEVAAGNPYAWSPTARSAAEIAEVTSANRMIAFPYRKLMNSNIQTDQAAAVILCSVAAARRFGVPEDRWVFPVAGADCRDTWFVSERRDFVSAPGLRAAFEALSPAAVDHMDLYSCFPSAVEIAAAELGLSLDRQLTVTGGLTFAGGPGNNYVLHSIASMAEVLRRDPGSTGLVTGIGWYLTKHSLGLYSTTPPADGFRAYAPDPPEMGREAAPDYEGPCTVETYTVTYSRDGVPEQGLFALLTPGGRRTWGSLPEADPMEDWIGRSVVLAADGRVRS